MPNLECDELSLLAPLQDTGLDGRQIDPTECNWTPELQLRSLVGKRYGAIIKSIIYLDTVCV